MAVCDGRIFAGLVMRGMTQGQLAQETGITRQYIGEIIRGRRTPTFSEMERISKALNMKVGDLFSRDHAYIPMGEPSSR